MGEKKKRFNRNTPEARALIDQIVHGTFMREGTMVAFPMCFPGSSVPIPADESHITALDVADDHIIYGGTSGRAAHLFVAIFHGVTGIVFDRGVVEGANHCAAVACGKTRFVACVNGGDGGRIVASGLQSLPFDLIQEWGFARRPIEEIGRLPGERIVHAVVDDARTTLVGVTSAHLFTVDIEGGKVEIVGEVQGRGRIAVAADGLVFGLDGAGHLWRYDIASREIRRRAISLPEGAWENVHLMWARDRTAGLLYTADAKGTLFSFDGKQGFGNPLGRTLVAPVGPMAATHDGRVFGFCGPELAKMFCCDPDRREVADLGVAVSVLERRRYGYVFGDAVTGRDGQIFFGENDDLGHLWLYFPSIRRRKA